MGAHFNLVNADVHTWCDEMQIIIIINERDSISRRKHMLAQVEDRRLPSVGTGKLYPPILSVLSIKSKCLP